MRLQELIEQFDEKGIEYAKIEKAMRTLGITSTTLTAKEVSSLKNELGIENNPTPQPKQSGLVEAPPQNLGQSVQQINARDSLGQCSVSQAEQQLAAIRGQIKAEREEAIRLTENTAYQATLLQYRIQALQAQKEALSSNQPNSNINSFLDELGIPNPMSVCSNAVELASKLTQEISKLQQEKKA
jgi:hypothetical protein